MASQPDPPANAPPDPVAAFAAERRADIRRMRDDHELHRLSMAWMLHAARYRYTYNFTWLGRPVIQFPQDLIAVQELIWRTRPDLIIETGVAHGGSLVFWASLLELCGEAGHVLGIDIDIRPHNRAAIQAHPLAQRITLLEGSSTDPAIVAKARALANRHHRTMVLLDSHHAHDHVLAELRAYAPLVTPACYLVVFDTVIEALPPGFLDDSRWDKGDNPHTAVHAFLAETDRFVIDHAVSAKLLITVSPDGYLRCIKD